MRCIYLAILFTIVSNNVSGQININDLQKVNPKLKFNQPKFKFKEVATNSPVRYLSLENIPCLTPDIRVVAKIANPDFKRMESKIPNPFRPVKTFLGIKPKKSLLFSINPD